MVSTSRFPRVGGICFICYGTLHECMVFQFVTIFVGDLCRGGICLARSAVRYK